MSEKAQDFTQDVASVVTLGAVQPARREGPSAPPPPEKKLVMPIADERTAREARRRAIVKQRSRGGRASTILTERETLG